MLKENPPMKIKAVLLLAPFLLLLSGCTQQVSLKGSEQELAQRNVTESKAILYPDDRPSIPDGKAVWVKMNCAECHGTDGQPVAGKAKVVLSNLDYMDKQKPVEQYAFLTYGKEGSSHPVLKDKLNTREIWNLTFYTRSLAIAPLSQAEWEQVDPVFGSNCAVCHGKKGFGDGPLAHNMEPVPANFHQFNRFFDRDDFTLYDHIANGINNDQGKPTFSGMPNFKDKLDKQKNVKFDDAYMRKLVQYVRQFHSSIDPTLAQADSAKKQ
jgi:mono/diheme cytochrome c family protein